MVPYGVVMYFIGFDPSWSLPMLLVDMATLLYILLYYLILRIYNIICLVVSKCFNCFTPMPIPAFRFPKETQTLLDHQATVTNLPVVFQSPVWNKHATGCYRIFVCCSHHPIT
jgi:hypothetical protein